MVSEYGLLVHSGPNSRPINMHLPWEDVAAHCHRASPGRAPAGAGGRGEDVGLGCLMEGSTRMPRESGCSDNGMRVGVEEGVLG